MSSSTDGLINTYDIRVVDEDDALLTTAQVGASLIDAGWMALECGSAGEMKGAWGVTSIETVQLWDVEEVCLLFDYAVGISLTSPPSQSALIVDVGDIRDVCLEPWRSDYLIGAHFNLALSGMCIIAGTQRFVLSRSC